MILMFGITRKSLVWMKFVDYGGPEIVVRRPLRPPKRPSNPMRPTRPHQPLLLLFVSFVVVDMLLSIPGVAVAAPIPWSVAWGLTVAVVMGLAVF